MAETILTLKTCTMCKVEKPTSDFYIKRDKKDGLSSNCRRCHQHPVKLTEEERRNKIHWRFQDLAGTKFGKLTAVSRDKSRRGTFWTCLCDCGNTTTVAAGNLKSGAQISCGCVHRQLAGARQFRHGMVGSREYQAWTHAKKRCTNPRDGAYRNYGGRGITMCRKWTESFQAFYEDMGPCPEGLTLDRIDNEGHYEPGNCRWTNRVVQNNNTRNTVLITYEGVTRSMSEWAELKGISKSALRYRYENGLPLFEPSRMKRLT